MNAADKKTLEHIWAEAKRSRIWANTSRSEVAAAAFEAARDSQQGTSDHSTAVKIARHFTR